MVSRRLPLRKSLAVQDTINVILTDVALKKSYPVQGCAVLPTGRMLGSQTNFTDTLDPSVSVHAQLAVKDEYTFAFLDLEDAHSERELERALTGRVEAFLREMGDMFTFVGSQYKLQVGKREFFLDLLLYHRRLHALVALELKIGEFEPEYIGKMQSYLSVLDDKVRLPEERWNLIGAGQLTFQLIRTVGVTL